MKTWLEESRQLDMSNSRLRITAQKLTQSRQSLPARAAAVHDFVRRMPFAMAPNACDSTASEVLQRGAGDCYSKGLLFTALCRAADLPARMLFVRVRTDFLDGVLVARPDAITHAVGQVKIGARWWSTDGYVVDPLLFARAKELLRATGLRRGWGIVAGAAGQWDGQSMGIQQFRPAEMIAMHGVFDDVDAFRASGRHEPPDWFDTVRFTMASCLVNWRVARLRSDCFDVGRLAAEWA